MGSFVTLHVRYRRVVVCDWWEIKTSAISVLHQFFNLFFLHFLDSPLKSLKTPKDPIIKSHLHCDSNFKYKQSSSSRRQKAEEEEEANPQIFQEKQLQPRKGKKKPRS